MVFPFTTFALMTESPGLPAGRAVVWDDRVRLMAGASMALGGAPWRVLRIAPAGRDFVRRLASAGAAGLVPSPGLEHRLADILLTRGIVHPAAMRAPAPPIDVVVPVYEHPDSLDRCLTALCAASPDAHLIVVDDGSTDGAVGDIALAHGATLVRHPENRGPAAARNTGLRHASAELVAFVDADCSVTSGWLDPLVAHFDDPRVAAVAPRVQASGPGLLGSYQQAHSSLDMGPRPELVSPGAPLGYVPSAVLLVRRESVAAFDEDLRVGEDVDLIWRLVDGGAMVRYEPAATVDHATRPSAREWAARIFDYGTSAAELDRRHPGRLTPARFSPWTLTAAAILLARKPSAPVRLAGAAVPVMAAAVRVARTVTVTSAEWAAVPAVLATTARADVTAVGHLLRREWWPLGWPAILFAPRSRTARAVTAAMLAPLLIEWFRRRPGVDPMRYVALRLADDAAYGSGVIAGATRSRRLHVLRPALRRRHQKKPTALSL